MTVAATFTLDTSGFVPVPLPDHDDPFDFRWIELTPFQQGAMHAASEEASRLLGRKVGFSSWSGDALGIVLRDCDAFEAAKGVHLPDEMRRQAGARFWADRQRSSFPACPALTLFQSHEGDVCARKAR